MTQALNKEASRHLLRHPETSTTVRISRENARYTKHQGLFTDRGWGLNREGGERRCDGRSKCWLHEHDKKTKSRVVHVIILCYMPCAKEFTTRGAKNCFKPPPICLCSKREDAGGVDHLLLLEQVHAVWAKKPETSASVPIKRCEFYQPSHNTASYLQLSSCQS